MSAFGKITCTVSSCSDQCPNTSTQSFWFNTDTLFSDRDTDSGVMS